MSENNENFKSPYPGAKHGLVRSKGQEKEERQLRSGSNKRGGQITELPALERLAQGRPGSVSEAGSQREEIIRKRTNTKPGSCETVQRHWCWDGQLGWLPPCLSAAG